MLDQAVEKPALRAIVAGQEFTEVPHDLYIPPDALEVLLDTFSGPLDLLLYLIRKQNLDILDIPIVSITHQYLQYIQMMQANRLELAADYLLMAAMLAEIKSRLLLPRVNSDENQDEDDPRMELVRRLQAYEQMKQASEAIDCLSRNERDTFVVQLLPENLPVTKLQPVVTLEELLSAMSSILVKQTQMSNHQIQREPLSVRARMSYVLLQLQEYGRLELRDLFTAEEGRSGLVVTLLAILELARQSLIIITQAQAFSTIHLERPI